MFKRSLLKLKKIFFISIFVIRKIIKLKEVSLFFTGRSPVMNETLNSMLQHVLLQFV